MHQNVTVAEAIVLSCFDLKPPRNRIVFEEGLFPSVRYVQQAWSRFGAEVVVCEDADAVIDAIDERTLLVPISHVLYKTAEIQPIERIVERAHEVGAYVCLDAYQSAGAVPLDVTALGIEFCVGGSVKWLCGGPGAGWLYVRPDLAEQLEPAFAGWQGHARPFAFETEMEPAPGAARFLTGTPVVAANYAASAGLRDRRGDRRRADPRELDAADGAARRPRRRGRLRAHLAARAGDPRRLGRLPRAGLPGGARRARGARDHLRLPPRRGPALRAALLHDRRRDPLRRRAGASRSSTPARTSRASAPTAGY